MTPLQVLTPLLALLQAVSSDVFTALVQMESLVQTEFLLANQLEAFIQAEESRLQQLKG